MNVRGFHLKKISVTKIIQVYHPLKRRYNKLHYYLFKFTQTLNFFRIETNTKLSISLVGIYNTMNADAKRKSDNL